MAPACGGSHWESVTLAKALAAARWEYGGDTASNAGGAAGLVGTADDGRAIYLENNSPSGLPTAFIRKDASGQLALFAG